ncbi:MAG: ABC transporter permease [Blastocatellia bacterium]|nr:ABC transporter permease [Blastocatellia bacterium]
METLRQDLWYGLRRLAQSPGFTLVAALSLAIGIGGNSAIFSVANGLLLRPLPFKDAERLTILWNRSPGLNIEQDWFSLGQYLDIKLENRVFEQVAVTLGGSFNLTGEGIPEHVEGARVSSSLFPLLGAQPALGQLFQAQDDEKGRAPGVILSHGFWHRRFGGDRNVIGRTMRLNDQNVTITGVLQPGFSLGKEVMPTVNGIQRADVLLPLPLSEADRTKRGGEDFNIFAKLKPGVSVAAAQADMNAIAEQMKRQYPDSYPANGGLTLSVVPLLDQVVGDVRRSLYVLLAAVGVVLLIACANVANLLLARATVRQKEIAIRTAIGASRGRIIRQLLTESVALSLLGGLIGLGIAIGMVRVLHRFGAAGIPRLAEVGIDARVLGFTFLVSLFTGLLFGLAPALRASRVDLNESLKEGGRHATGGGPNRLRNLLVVAEVALSLIVLISAGLLIRSYRQILQANPGFDPRNLLSLKLTLSPTRYPTPESVYNFYKQLGEKVKQLPGVESMGMSHSLPFSATSAAWGPITVEGYVPRAATELIISNERFATPDQLRAMGRPLIRGRFFDERDIKGAPEVTIVNEAFANRFWPNEDPIGKRIQRGGQGAWRQVVGVVRDEKQVSLENEPAISTYHPIDQFTIRSRYLIARTTSDPSALLAPIAREVHSLDPELPVYDADTMEERLRKILARRRFAMVLLGVFAGVALLLSAMGIYGVMGYWVTQRTHEIGIRMALGAQPGNILQMVMRQAMLLVSAGIAIGLAGGLLFTRYLSGLLFGVSPRDGLTFLSLALLLAAIAFVAGWLPARRAARVDPMIALRFE